VPSLYLLIGGYTRPASYTAELLDRLREREKAKGATPPPQPAE
jgi:multidrug efflux pump